MQEGRAPEGRHRRDFLGVIVTGVAIDPDQPPGADVVMFDELATVVVNREVHDLLHALRAPNVDFAGLDDLARIYLAEQWDETLNRPRDWQGAPSAAAGQERLVPGNLPDDFTSRDYEREQAVSVEDEEDLEALVADGHARCGTTADCAPDDVAASITPRVDRVRPLDGDALEHEAVALSEHLNGAIGSGGAQGRCSSSDRRASGRVPPVVAVRTVVLDANIYVSALAFGGKPEARISSSASPDVST